MQHGPYQVTDRQPIYQNPWITVREDRVKHPGGRDGLFGVVTLKPGSTVLALTADRRVHLSRGFKYAYGRESIELISGGLDAGESPLDAARRELTEETGLTATDWTDLGVIHPFTVTIDSPNYMFLATGLEKVERAGDPHEPQELFTASFEEALAMASDGRIVHAASVVAIHKAARLLQRGELPEA